MTPPPSVPPSIPPNAHERRISWKSLFDRPVAPAATAAPAAGANPTKAEFDKLVADVAAMRTAMNGS
jgi:hypothetical protein